MGNSLNLNGRKFGRLTVVEIDKNNQNAGFTWICKCDCGKEKSILGSHLISGNSKSCGCFHKERVRLSKTKHGHNTFAHKSITYQTWESMYQRCYNKQSPKYKHYGQNDIKICKEWMDFRNFLRDMGERPSKDYSIDRIDNNGDYKPSNCRWATSKEQNRNKKNNRNYTYKNKTQCITAWAEEYNINQYTLSKRINRDKLSIEEALIKLIKKRKCKI